MDPSNAGRMGIFPRWTNRKQDTWVYSHDGPIKIRHSIRGPHPSREFCADMSFSDIPAIFFSAARARPCTPVRQSDSQTVDSRTVRQSDSRTVRQSDSQTVGPSTSKHTAGERSGTTSDTSRRSETHTVRVRVRRFVALSPSLGRRRACGARM
eukprot:8986680-Pyramimonas_sp.AAC.1